MKNIFKFLTLCFLCSAFVLQSFGQASDGVAECAAPDPSSIDPLTPPVVTEVCADGSTMPAVTFTPPMSNLPDIEFVIEVNGSISDINGDGSIDPGTLAVDDQVCVSAVAYSQVGVQTLLDDFEGLCGLAETFGQVPPGTCDAIYGPPLNGMITSLSDVLDVAASFGVAVGSVADIVLAIDGINGQVGGFGLPPVCYATTAAQCYTIVDCAAACAIEADLMAAPAPPTVTESVCAADGVTLEGGVVDPITCPEGSTAEYSIDGGATFAAAVPAYDQTTAITVTVRCLCDEDMTIASPTAEVTTVPGVCDAAACAVAADLAAAPAPPTFVDAACDAGGMTLISGSIDYTPVVCPAGSTAEYSTDGGTTWVAAGPAYDDVASITVTVRCLCDEDMMTASPTAEITTAPGSCDSMPPDGTAGNCGIIAGEPSMATAEVCNTELSALDVTAIFGDPGPAGTPSLVQNYAVVDPATGDLITISSTAVLDLSMVAVGGEACVSSVAYTQETLDAITAAVDGVTQFPGSPIPAFGSLDLSGFLNGLNGAFEIVGFEFTQADIQNWCETQMLTIPFSLIPGGLIPDLTLDLMTLIPPDGFCCDFSDNTYCITVINCLEPCDPACANEMFIQIESIEVADPVAVVGELNPFGDFNGCAGAGTLDGADSFIELDLVINGTMLAQISIDGGTAGVTAGPFGGYNSVGTTACGGTTVDAGVSVLEDDSGLGGGADDLTDNATETFDLAGGTYTACGGGLVITYSVMCGPPDCAAMCAGCAACDVVACDPLISTTTAPPAVVTSESTCEGDGVTLSGGVIDVPAAACPAGSTLEYSVDGGATWSATLPTYNQTTAVTVDTRCVCDSDDTDISTVASVTTVPGSCMMVACEAAAPVISNDGGDCPADADGSMNNTPFVFSEDGSDNTTPPYITEYIVTDGPGGIIIGVFPTLADADAAANAEGIANGDACIQAINHDPTGLDVIVAEIDQFFIDNEPLGPGLTLCALLGPPCPTYGNLVNLFGAINTLAPGVATVAIVEQIIVGDLSFLVPGLMVPVSPFCYELSNEDCITVMACDVVVIDVTLDITDPCNCDAGIDLDGNPANGNELAEETITITPGMAPFTTTTVTGLVDATGTALTPAQVDALIVGPDAMGNFTITAFVVADGNSPYTLTVMDANTTSATINGGGTACNCQMMVACNFSVGVSAFTCNDGGTMDDPSDDTADVTFVVLSNGSNFTTDVAIGGVTSGMDGMLLTETGVAAGTNILVTFTSVDDPNCTFVLDYTVPDCTVQIPTLSQWGLITLALMLIIIGSLKLGFNTNTFQRLRRN